MTETDVRYALRSRSTGRLVRMDVRENGPDADFCGENTCRLSLTGNRRYEPESLTDVLATLRTDTPWFNSSEERPGWGGLDLSDFGYPDYPVEPF